MEKESEKVHIYTHIYINVCVTESPCCTPETDRL